MLPLLQVRAEISFEEGIKKRLGRLTEENLPGLAVLVSRDGRIVYQGGFGWADLEKKTPVTAKTKFRIGSVTKQFTAAAILRLAEEGKLAVTDPLAEFFPGFPDGVTLQHLLTHSSGIHSYTDTPEFLDRVGKLVRPSELISQIRKYPPDFAPGKGFHYSNSAYFILGEIVAKVSGKSLSAYLQDVFFGPFGMNDTGVYLNSLPPAGMATGYSMLEVKPVVALDWDMSWAGGAGALYSTVGDLFRWNEALFGGTALKQASLNAMITPAILPDGVDGLHYGYGLVIADLNRLPAITHSGGLNGWSSDLLRLPEQHCTVITLANALPPVPGFEPTTISRQIGGKFLDADIKKLPPLEENPDSDRKNYPDYVGRYDYKNAVLTVSVEGEHLFAQLTGQEKFEIFPATKDAFFWKVTDAKVDFLRDDTGKVTAARHTQAGNSFKADRMPDVEIQLTDAELDAILGQYQYGPAAILTVTRDGASVFAQLTGQPKFQIYPKSATEFEWRVVKASVTFKKDGKDKVFQATHQQNGKTFDAVKLN